MELSVKEIAEKIQGSISGDAALKISGISDLKGATGSQVSFILSEKHLNEALASKAPAIVSDSLSEIKDKTVIKVKSANAAYAGLLRIFYPEKEIKGAISPKAAVSPLARFSASAFIDDCVVIKEGAEIGEGAYIGAGSFIGENVKIYKGVRIYPNVTLYRDTVIGEDTIIHSGCVIGADGFRFIEDSGKIVKVLQIGNVVIGSLVEIGANCTIDRAAFGSTVIGNYVKMDNMVHIGHNVTVGDGTMIVAQTGVSGSVNIGKYCIIGGQVGIVDHVDIADGAKIGAQSGITKDVAPGAMMSGTPARPLMKLRRNEAYVGKLEDLFKRVKQIEAEIKKSSKEK